MARTLFAAEQIIGMLAKTLRFGSARGNRLA